MGHGLAPGGAGALAYGFEEAGSSARRDRPSDIAPRVLMEKIGMGFNEYDRGELGPRARGCSFVILAARRSMCRTDRRDRP